MKKINLKYGKDFIHLKKIKIYPHVKFKKQLERFTAFKVVFKKYF